MQLWGKDLCPMLWCPDTLKEATYYIVLYSILYFLHIKSVSLPYPLCIPGFQPYLGIIGLMHLWTRTSIPNNVIYCSRPTSGTLFSIRIWHLMFDTNMVPCLSYMEAQTSDHSGERENLKHLGSLSHTKTKEIYNVLEPWEVNNFISRENSNYLQGQKPE